MARKSVRDFVLEDMWNHNLMSGDEIRGCVTGEKYATAEDKLGYCKGIFCMFPHMMFGNFSRWMWENPPKDYNAFLEPSVAALQEKVVPELEKFFLGGISENEKGETMARLLTEVIPQHIITGFYDYMFAGSEDYKDISSFWTEVQPLLGMTAELARASYGGMSVEERAEAFSYFGARYPFLMLKRWYDWSFGKDKLEMGPPPGEGGPGPGGPPPM